MIRRFIVTGDRHWHCDELALRTLHGIAMRHGPKNIVVVHGACTGVDSAFAQAAHRLGIQDEPHPAANHGPWPRCGPIRNSHMVSLGATYAIAVHQDLPRSRGTIDCVRKCLKAHIPVYLVDDIHPTKSLSLDDIPKQNTRL